ncbi:hypothetical protein [Thiohalocapsa sp.]|nr:hypothetical protein [Thiohalocapsa sp.]
MYRAPEHGAYATSFQLAAPYRITPALLGGVAPDLAALVTETD